MGFVGILLALAGIAALALTMVGCAANGDPNHKTTSGDVVFIAVLAIISVVFLIAAGYCVG